MYTGLTQESKNARACDETVTTLERVGGQSCASAKERITAAKHHGKPFIVLMELFYYHLDLNERSLSVKSITKKQCFFGVFSGPGFLNELSFRCYFFAREEEDSCMRRNRSGKKHKMPQNGSRVPNPAAAPKGLPHAQARQGGAAHH
jgi:hypothetical protein